MSRTRSSSFACTLLSLFTTKRRAAEIEGDLIEERDHRGSSWFALHVIGTTCALFLESFKQAPFRTMLLGATAAGVSVAACDVLARAFFAPDALIPVPVLGFLAIVAWAFLIGFGLEHVAPGLGVRAATFAAVLLTLLFFLAQTLARSERLAADLEAGIGVAVLNAAVSMLAMLGGFGVSIVTFLAPLMAGGVCAQSRSGRC